MLQVYVNNRILATNTKLNKFHSLSRFFRDKTRKEKITQKTQRLSPDVY